MKFQSISFGLFACAFISPLHAASILLVSDADVPGAGGGQNQRDDAFVDFLQDLGHSVDTSGMSSAYRTNQQWWADGDKVAAIDAADMVIVSRRTSSGDYRGAEGIAVQAWNGLEKPLMLMSAFITRDSRWGWQSGGNINAPDNTETEMTILVPESPLVAGLDGSAEVFDWTGPSIGGNDNPNPGVWPKEVTAPEISSVTPSAEVVGQFGDRAFLFHIPEGGDWTTADGGVENPAQDGIMGGPRVFLGHWGYDIEDYNFMDLTTGDFLSLVSNSINFLAPPDIGLTCDFDANLVCDVADVDMLLSALGSDDPTFELDGLPGITLGDRDAWLTQASEASDPRVVLVTGDTDLDGDVDAGDLNNLGIAWQRTDNPGWGDGDFDGNDVVNAGDLNDVGLNWLHPAAAASAAAVPEPGSMGLLLISLFGLLGLRRA